MEHHVGIYVSLEQSRLGVVDTTGKIVREAKVASEPEALVGFFRQLGLPLTRIGPALVALTMAPGGADLLQVPPPPWANLSA